MRGFILLDGGPSCMPRRPTARKAKDELREGYAPTTAAGEFVREEMHHKEDGKHGAESRRQAIAIGLSKARRAGIPVGEAPRRRTTRKPKRKFATPYGERRIRTRADGTRSRTRKRAVRAR